MLLRIFQSQVRDQCMFLLMSAEAANKAMQNLGAAGPRIAPDASDLLWFSLQNLLTAAANISKALWGSGGKSAEARRALRESLGVPDDSPLRETILRNHYEHFDERLDKWWQESTNHNYADRNIGPPTMIGGIQSTDNFRTFDPATNIAAFWGDEFNTLALVEAANELYPVAHREASKPHW
jgi:hypothetical protein